MIWVKLRCIIEISIKFEEVWTEGYYTLLVRPIHFFVKIAVFELYFIEFKADTSQP